MSHSTATIMVTDSRLQTSMRSHYSRPPEETKNSVPNQSEWESHNDPYHKLEVAMKYLGNIDKDATFYIETSQKIMQHLHEQFEKSHEVYLPWVRFFDISAIKKEGYVGKKEGS